LEDVLFLNIATLKLGGITMLKIAEKDINFGKEVDAIAKSCPREFSCFQKETEEDQIPYANRCQVYGLKQDLQENFPLFLTFLRESAQKAFSFHLHEEGCPFAQRRNLWILSLGGTATLYSVNGRHVPPYSEELIANLESQADQQPGEFYTNIYRELENLNPFWLEEFSREAKEMGVTGYTWGLVLKVLSVFLEEMKGMELPEQFTETDFKYLENYLKSRSEGP